MPQIDRYLTREILGPLGLGFLVYTFLLLMQTFFRLAALIIRQGVPAGQVGELLLLSLPNIVVLTIPMSFLFAVLVAVGRMSADSELTALRASGVSLLRLYRPVALISVLLTLVNAGLMIYLLPRGNHALQRLKIEIVSQSVNEQVQPRVFYEGWEGLVLWVFSAPAGQTGWQGVFLADSVPAGEHEVTVARRGEMKLSEDGERLILELEDADSHRVDFAEPERYKTVHYRVLDRLVEDQFTSQRQATATASKGRRELTLGELRRGLGDPNLPAQLSQLYAVEIHKKFSIPVVCIVFGLLGLPLGLSNHRGGRSSGFALSIAVILIYYVLINNGEETARIGRMEPWLAMWLPNLLLGVVGLVLLVRTNQGRSILPHRLSFWLRRHVGQIGRRQGRLRRRRRRPAQRPARAGEPPQFVLRLPRLRFQFPNLTDRYVLRIFFSIFLMVMLSTLSIYVIADFTEKSDQVFENQIAAEVVVDYYKYFLPQIYYDLAPIGVLVTTLIAFALLSRSNEVLALKAAGISLYRLALPAVVGAALVMASSALLQATVLPAANERAAKLKDQIKGEDPVRTYRRADRQWLFGQGRYIYNYLRYDPDREALQRLQVFRFGEDLSLERRLYAESARYLDGYWVASGTWVRTFGEQGERFERYDEPLVLDFPEKPEYFESEVKTPAAMSYGELRDYLGVIESSGQQAPELEVELARKLSFPAAPVIMALVALPFSFRLGRKGALYGMGIGIVLGMVYFGLLALFVTLGEAGALPATIAVWSPNLLFALLSLYLFLGVRS